MKAIESKLENEHSKVEDILDGADMNQDIHQLIGYCVSLGREKEPPSDNFSELAEEFLRKYRVDKKLAEQANNLADVLRVFSSYIKKTHICGPDTNAFLNIVNKALKELNRED